MDTLAQLEDENRVAFSITDARGTTLDLRNNRTCAICQQRLMCWQQSGRADAVCSGCLIAALIRFAGGGVAPC